MSTRLTPRQRRIVLDLLAGVERAAPDVDRIYERLRGVTHASLAGEDVEVVLAAAVESTLPWTPRVISLIRKLERSLR